MCISDWGRLTSVIVFGYSFLERQKNSTFMRCKARIQYSHYLKKRKIQGTKSERSIGGTKKAQEDKERACTFDPSHYMDFKRSTGPGSVATNAIRIS
jgi:hypothetical protein